MFNNFYAVSTQKIHYKKLDQYTADSKFWDNKDEYLIPGTMCYQFGHTIIVECYDKKQIPNALAYALTRINRQLTEQKLTTNKKEA